MTEGIANMLQALEAAARESHDPPPPEAIIVSRPIHTGRPGRPRIEINPIFLEVALDLRGPTGIAPVVGTAARTVRRRALEHGLVEPGPPVYVDTPDPNNPGVFIRRYTSSTPVVTTLTNEQLDTLVSQALEIFPSFGRRMLDGFFRAIQEHVPRERIRASYERVRGAPASLINRPIERRVYHVAGPNSLCHHDGQHGALNYVFIYWHFQSHPSFLGLKRWNIIIHAFIDGFSRFVTGIHVVDNNRALTVLNLFLEQVIAHGIPRRVRGDHGTENLEVAAWMEERFGVERGSYIWGRSDKTLLFSFPL